MTNINILGLMENKVEESLEVIDRHTEVFTKLCETSQLLKLSDTDTKLTKTFVDDTIEDIQGVVLENLRKLTECFKVLEKYFDDTIKGYKDLPKYIMVLDADGFDLSDEELEIRASLEISEHFFEELGVRYMDANFELISIRKYL